jgi:hypothetical protein
MHAYIQILHPKDDVRDTEFVQATLDTAEMTRIR